MARWHSPTSLARWTDWIAAAAELSCALLARSDKPRVRCRHRHVFWLTLALGGGGLVVAAGGLVAAIRSIHPASGRAGRITLAGLDFSYPRLNVSEAVLLTVAAVGTLAIATAIRAGWRQRRALRSFLARLEVLGPLETHPVITVIADRRPQAFCAGFVRPK